MSTREAAICALLLVAPGACSTNTPGKHSAPPHEPKPQVASDETQAPPEPAIEETSEPDAGAAPNEATDGVDAGKIGTLPDRFSDFPVSIGRYHGGLDPNDVRRVIRATAPRLRRCYQQALAKNPTVTARMSPRFVIAADGSVSSVTLQQPSGDASLDTCVVNALGQMRFSPPPDGGTVTVTYPLVLDRAQ